MLWSLAPLKSIWWMLNLNIHIVITNNTVSHLPLQTLIFDAKCPSNHSSLEICETHTEKGHIPWSQINISALLSLTPLPFYSRYPLVFTLKKVTRHNSTPWINLMSKYHKTINAPPSHFKPRVNSEISVVSCFAFFFSLACSFVLAEFTAMTTGI